MTSGSMGRGKEGARAFMPRGLAVLCIATLLFACSPASKEGKKPVASLSPAIAETATSDPTPRDDASPAPKPLGGDHHLVFQALPLALSSSRVFGPASAGGPLTPEDFAIGSLADSRPEALDESAALAAARGFLDGIVKGSYREDLALPGRGALVALLAAPLLKEPRPASYRIGKLKIGEDAAAEEEVAACRLRLGAPRQKESAEPSLGVSSRPETQTGEISLRREGKTWYVESILLDEAKASDGSPFEPGFDEE
jgi:hypothetical protein